MEAFRGFAERAAEVLASVLLMGETGTGKTLAARWIHARSRRRDGPFVAVNCAAIPEALFESELFGHRRGAFTGASDHHPGLFALASGGTLLLDEVGELDPGRQAKLLTVLEDGEVRAVGARQPRPVDVRVMAATSRDLARAVAESSFRADLYHRLALLAWRLPPLRERGDDVLLLAARFLERFGRRHGVPGARLTPDARALVRSHPWPGNVRELSHALEAALILGEEAEVGRGALERVLGRLGATTGEGIGRADGTRGGRYSFDGSPDEEREVIRSTLLRCRGNRTRTARALGMSRNTLRDRLRRYRLDG